MPTRPHAVPIPKEAMPESVPGATTRLAPPSNAHERVTKPQPAHQPAAVPLPGGSPTWEEESTRVAPVQLPKEAYAPKASTHAAVPLPGSAAAWDEESTRVAPIQIPKEAYATGAVPLPGGSGAVAPPPPPARAIVPPPLAPPPVPRAPVARAGAAVPLPGSYEVTHTGPVPTANMRAGSGAVPLPGGGGGDDPFDSIDVGGAVPLPGGHAAGSYDETSTGAVPLPGGNDAGSYDLTNTNFSPPRGAPIAQDAREPSSGAVPLPGNADVGFDVDMPPEPTHGAVPLPGHSTQLDSAYPPPDPGGFEPESTQGATPSFNEAPEASSVDFSEVPSEPPPPAPMAFELPPPAPAPAAPQGFDFSDLPSPAGQPPPAMDFSLDSSRPPEPDNLPSPADDNLPSPAIADLPSPADAASGGDLGFDFSSPPPPAAPAAPVAPVNPATSFGEVDFGGGGDSLEFDPTAKPKGDDLEADLSSPLPPPRAPAGGADGLEMLSFIDDTAKEHGVADSANVRRFHIKRRSGKVFGPFEEAVVVKMLEEGQLLGNEEVSNDGENWQPIGSEASFQAAITKLMEQPKVPQGAPPPQAAASGEKAAPSGVPGAQNRPPPPSMERLKQLYEGRMAAVAVVQGKDPVPFTKRLPLIIAGVVVAMIAIAGVWSSTTRYGVFGLKVLFPAKVSANTEEFRTLTEAKKSLLVDTFKAYKSSKELCEKLLRIKQYPEVRAVWMQALFYLDRRYGAATPAELQTAEAETENLLLLGEKHVEVVKAFAGQAIEKKDYDKALSLVASARARADNEGDVELLFLKAEALAAKGQVPQAMTDLKEVLTKQKDSARALHALGLLHLKQKELDLAAGRFGEALAAAPEHGSSAVELAAIELNERKNVEKGTQLLEQALSEKVKPNLAPAELGRALAMRAQVLAGQKKLDEAIEAFDAALKADPSSSYAKAAYGALLNERHDFAKALPMLKDAAEKVPDNLVYIEAYLNALVGVGKMDEATKVMKAAENRFPGNARIAFLSARVDDGMDRTKTAEQSYKKAIKDDPKMVEANIGLAALYLRLHRFPEAKPQLEEAVSKAPDNAEVRVGLGELALAEKDFDKADEELRKAVDLNPNLPGAFLGLSKVALAKNKLEVAEQQAQKALKLDPRIQDGRLQMGTVLWKLQRYDDAIKELEQAKVDEPRSVAILVTLGAVNFDKGDMEAATANLLTAIQKESGNAEANFYMARVKNKRSEHTQAIEYMKKALDVAPRRPDFHYVLGNIYLDAKKGGEAIDEWKAALALDPKYADPLEALGHDALNRGKTKEAIDFFDRTLAADPSRTRIHAAIGEAWMSTEQWGKAIEAFLAALESEPGLADVYPRLAQAYGEKKKWTEAINWYRKAVAHDPQNGQAWLSLGWALAEKKQTEDAIDAFQHFLAVNTDPKQKKEIEDQIYYMKHSGKGD